MEINMELDHINSSTGMSSNQASAPVADDQQAGVAESEVPSSSDKIEAAETNNTSSIRMDPKIFTAAAGGDTEALSRHGETLHKVLTPTRNTVLHIYVAHARYPPSSRSTIILNPTGFLLDQAGRLRIEKGSGSADAWAAMRAVRPTTYTLNASQVQRSKNVVTQLLGMCPELLFQPNNNGDTALHIAARYGLKGIVEVLIEAAKARPRDVENQVEEPWRLMLKTTNNEGDTALHEATRFNHIGVVQKLCGEDQDFTYSANVAGRTPVYLAAERGNRATVSTILKLCNHPDYQGPSGKTALHAAVISNDTKMTQELLDKEKKSLDFTQKNEEKSLQVQTRDDNGWTPLHFAALIGNLEIVRQLLDCDTSIAYTPDKEDKKTALHIAASKGHIRILIELMDRCPDCCEIVDRNHKNILHYAIENQKFSVVSLIQDFPWASNILLNGKDAAGNTPFHHMVIESLIQDGRIPSRFVRDARVDKMASNKENLNAIDIFVDKGQSLAGPERENRSEASKQDGANITIDNDYSLSEMEKARLEALENSGARPSHPRIIENKSREVDTAKKEVGGVLLVVATLIATVTFAAGFTVPGGYHTEKGPEQGYAILIRNTAFQAFVITNTIALVTSSGTVLAYLLVSSQLAGKNIMEGSLTNVDKQVFSILFAMFAMIIAYITGMYSVLGHSSALAAVVCVMGGVFYGLYIWNSGILPPFLRTSL